MIKEYFVVKRTCENIQLGQAGYIAGEPSKVVYPSVHYEELYLSRNITDIFSPSLSTARKFYSKGSAEEAIYNLSFESVTNIFYTIATYYEYYETIS